MKITNGLGMLELTIQGFTLNPTLIWDETMALLIDTGVPGQGKQIIEAIEKTGVPFEKLTAVILTHQDIDHVGSLPELLNLSANHIDVYAHKLDKPYIEGDFSLIKTDPSRMSKEAWASLPEGMKQIYANPPKSKVNHILEDEQYLPFFGGIQVIFTPGHTPGHISLYLKESKTLIAGDSLVAAEGILHGPVERTTLDMDLAMKSISKFLDFEIDTVICYHGGLVNNNPLEQLKKLISPSAHERGKME